MHLFIISKNGDGLDLAEKLHSEEHQVSLYARNKSVILPKSEVTITKNPTADMIQAELIIVEDDKSGEFVERARKLGRPVIGGGKVIDRLDKESKFGTEVLIGCGFDLAGEKTTGTLLEVGGWFTQDEFLKPYFIAWKYLKFGTGDVGPEIGPMGIVGTYKLKGKIFRESIEQLKTFLKSIGYVGYIGLDVLVNNDKFHVVGWKTGLSYPMVSLLPKLHNNLGTFLFKVARGTAKVVAVQPDRVGVGVTWLKLPWICESPMKHRPELICEVGLNIEEASSKVFKTIHKTLTNDEYYRTDIGKDTKESLIQLMDDGWL